MAPFEHFLLLASIALQIWIIWIKRCFEWIFFSYFVYIVVIITLKILQFQFGDSFLVTACRTRMLRRMLANQIYRYTQIALECVVYCPHCSMSYVILKGLKISNGLWSDGFNLRMTDNNKIYNDQKIGQTIVYNTLLKN